MKEGTFFPIRRPRDPENEVAKYKQIDLTFFSDLGQLSQTFTIHRATGEGGDLHPHESAFLDVDYLYPIAYNLLILQLRTLSKAKIFTETK